MYFKIISFLIVVMVVYYLVMIFLDIRAQKAKEAADTEKEPEVDIDISDEASSFKPTLISREEKMPVDTPSSEDSDNLEDDFNDNVETEYSEDSSEDTSEEEIPFRRPGYREAVMTDGISVEELLEEIDRMAENSSSDLGQIIHVWERA